MFDNDLQQEGLHGRVQNLVCNSRLDQVDLLHIRSGPHLLESQNPRDYPGFFPTADVWMGIQHGPHQGGATSGNPSDKDQRHVFVVSQGGVFFQAQAASRRNPGGIRPAEGAPLLDLVVALHDVMSQIEDSH